MIEGNLEKSERERLFDDHIDHLIAKKLLKKDGRWDMIEGNLEKSERERLFDDHIDHLIAKKKESYRSLLEEHKDLPLDATFKDIKKKINEDPRYTKFSSSDKKCEKNS